MCDSLVSTLFKFVSRALTCTFLLNSFVYRKYFWKYFLNLFDFWLMKKDPPRDMYRYAEGRDRSSKLCIIKDNYAGI
jgi:hypothetical protein